MHAPHPSRGRLIPRPAGQEGLPAALDFAWERHAEDASLVRSPVAIAGGIWEIQRNIIAQRVLGLPRDRRRVPLVSPG